MFSFIYDFIKEINLFLFFTSCSVSGGRGESIGARSFKRHGTESSGSASNYSGEFFAAVLGMPNQCVAASFSKSSKDGVPILLVLRDPVLRQRWTKQI